MLYEEQKKISSDILSNLENRELYNIPTGRGKTFILLDAAVKAIRKLGKKVIISTPNNNLVRDMYNTAINYDFKLDESNTTVKIGMNNYVSKDKLNFYCETGLIYDYITKESMENYLEFCEKEEGNLFIDQFNEQVEYTDIFNEKIVNSMICKTNLDTIEFNDLTITNHFYLLSKTIYDKSFDISEYVVLVDEVHELSAVSESILTTSFSIFEYKNILHSFQKLISGSSDFIGKVAILKNLKTVELKCLKAHRQFSQPDRTGEYSIDASSSGPILTQFDKILNSRENLIIEKQISKIENRIKDALNLVSQYKKISLTYKDVLNVAEYERNKDLNNIGVYYSPSKGYPTLKSSSRNPLGELNVKFWKKVNYFAGVSATVTCSFKPTQQEINFGYSRLGMREKNSQYSIKYYDRLFPIDDISIYLPEKNEIEIESVYDDNFIISNSLYYNYIVDYIHKNHKNKNSLILCGGYKEAECIYSLYKSKYDGEENLHLSKSTEKASATLGRFKTEGGLLFATRNYNTGISLKGELLEAIFILKLPYPIFTTKRWLELKQRNAAGYYFLLNNEMLIAFMQTLGRLQRASEDTGDIHLLDKRYFTLKSNVKRAIVDIINNYGTMQKDIKKEKIIKIPTKNEKEDIKKSLLAKFL